ncbi:transcription regulator [Nitrososphaeria virus YSH_462411]|uniref:Transcription regulator n=1 Tax=Nitrososphaeria virus YSH_462411 TaxID=3071321 RepID=A0A976UB63_9CAUD|nr:transcription regulator [Yangshan Harbor Nitrososphaeria virus]UVF62317.1 transcription regulator [Nitrososphaeria virus YSH_462411]
MNIEDMNKQELESLIKVLEKQWSEYINDDKKGMPKMELLVKARIRRKNAVL